MKCLPIYNKEYLKLLKDFERAVIAQGYSGGKDSLPRCLREFLFFLETKKINDIKEVKTSHILEFYEYLIQRPNMNYDGVLSNSGVRGILGSITHFFEYLVEAKVIESTPCALPRLPIVHFRNLQPLSEPEIDILYSAATDKMDRAILDCAYGCGMRRRELSNLNTDDFVFSKMEVAVRKSKNFKSRSIPLTAKIMTSLRDYLANDRPRREMYGRPSPAFFLNRSGKRMGTESFNNRFHALVAKTNDKALIAKNPSIHQLRHSITTHMIDRGADPHYVRRFLGHSLLDTTVNIYAKRRQQKAKLYKLFKNHLNESNIKHL